MMTTMTPSFLLLSESTASCETSRCRLTLCLALSFLGVMRIIYHNCCGAGAEACCARDSDREHRAALECFDIRS